MTVIAYVLISIFMALWLAVCIAVKISWVKEDRQAAAKRANKTINPNIFAKK